MDGTSARLGLAVAGAAPTGDAPGHGGASGGLPMTAGRAEAAAGADAWSSPRPGRGGTEGLPA